MPKMSKGGKAMPNEVIVAVLALVGTLIGTFGGIVTSSRLTAYRIEQLERKVDKHNGFAEKIPVIQEQIKVINHRIDDLESKE
nr:MAG TPA: Hemolysin [Caudoviricetes sp.]